MRTRTPAASFRPRPARHLQLAAAAGAFLAALATLLAPVPSVAADRPNIVVSLSDDKKAVEEHFEALFDGKTLSGWAPHGGMPEAHRGGRWWVEDGVLMGTQNPPSKGGILWLDRSFEDFILRLQVQLDYPMDSGVFVRMGPDGRSHQITLDHRPGSDVGAIYIPFGGGTVHKAPEGAKALREGKWNDLEIRMEGEPARIRVWLNGRLITDFQHTQETAEGCPPRGGIGLQVHPDVEGMTLWGKGHVVRFRNLRIKDLHPRNSHAQAEAKIVKKTFTYKTVDDLEIKLDLHRPDDDRIRPVAVSIHGGALINGGRGSIGRAARELLNEGYCIVSIDYRLAPETKLPEIVADIEDAFRWIHANARDKLKGDTSKLVVTGGSAGGHLTMTTGFRVKPRPAVLIAFWGYGDLIGPWYSEPSPHPRHHRSKMSAADAAKIEAGPPVANAGDREGNGGAYYQRCRQLGIWPNKVSNFDPQTEPEKFHPYMALKNVDENYPPILMIHGTADTDVPHEQSVLMAAELQKHGVPHQLISVKDGEHGLRGADQEEIEAAYGQVLPFIQKHTAR